MNESLSDDAALRVLVLAPTGRDASLIDGVLQRAQILSFTCRSVRELCDEARLGAGALLIAEEALGGDALELLAESLDHQAAWSDMPMIVLTGGGKGTPHSSRILRMLETSSNVSLLERPLRMLTLVTAANAALRARRRQYEVRSLLEATQNAVRQRDQFLAMLGHELRNPLAAIRTAIEVVNRFGADDAELAGEQCAIIGRQSSHMAKLVDDLLDVARITGGKITLDRRPVDLSDVVGATFKALRHGADAASHQIDLQSPGPVWVMGDAVRLAQVATNLLSNAVRYTPPGGSILIRVREEQDQGVLSVTDSGQGIPSDILPTIFEPFVQSKQTLARSRGGLGVGLTVVRSLVQMHGGSVAATSAGVGRGSEFVVRIPLASMAGEPSATSGVDGKTQSRRLLLIEDNADTRNAMLRLLRLWGHQVEVADTGKAGLDSALRDRPEIALVDIGLPDMDGYEVARQSRRALGQDIFLVALTGYGQPEDRRRAHAAGFNCHLVKPVDFARLRGLLLDPQAAKTDTDSADGNASP